jgi:uncharacterized protein (TIGR02145 family)
MIKMKKRIVFPFTFVLLFTGAFAQVGIGTNTPNANAVLELSSSTQGLKFPRLTTFQRTNITLPAKGLTVFDTEINCLMTNFGTSIVPEWKCLGGLPYTVPSAPTNPIATAIYKQASIAFTVSVFNGGTPITGYTVTATPGGHTATGTGSPLVVTGLTNGVSYTFNVVATNEVGNSLASSLSNIVTPNCGAFIAPGVYKVFACHNLNANVSLDPNVPAEGLHGNYYQWGKKQPFATPYGLIVTWNTTYAPVGAWLDGSKTINDPCPEGFRIPTKADWDKVLAFNTVSRTGSWLNSNFTTAIHYGPSSTIKTLTIPATGYLATGSGALSQRGNRGYVWSSTSSGSGNSLSGFGLGFFNSTHTVSGFIPINGFQVRCVSE